MKYHELGLFFVRPNHTVEICNWYNINTEKNGISSIDSCIFSSLINGTVSSILLYYLHVAGDTYTDAAFYVLVAKSCLGSLRI